MTLPKVLCALALVSVALPGFADVTGTWAGHVSATVPCVNSAQSLQIAGPVTLFVDQSPDGSRFFATGTALAAFPDNVACQAKGAVSIPFSITGNLRGDALSETVVLLPATGVFRPNGLVTGESLTLSGTGDFGGMISITATRIDKQSPPKFRTSDRYTGPYTFTANFSFRCNNVGPVTSSGQMQLTVGDVGRGITGGIRANTFTTVGPRGATGDCAATFVDPANLSILGTLAPGTENTVSGFIGLGFDFLPFTGTFDLRNFRGTATTPGGGKFEFDLTNSSPLRLPDIRSFESFPPSIALGEPARLVWRTEFTDKVSIDNGIGEQPPVGSVIARPTSTTVYTLTAINSGGTTQRTLTVNVRTESRVVVGEFPRGFTQRPNEGGGTDTFTLVNRGSVASNVTLTSADTFFTFSPASFALAAGASQVVTIAGKPSAPGVYRGSINVTASDSSSLVPVIRVGMVVFAGPGSGVVRPRSTTARAETSSTAGQNATGSVSFTNTGTATLQGVATASAPFIDPQDGLITIAPGQTVPVTYTINAGQRPLDSPIGAATGTISLRYLGGPSAGPNAAQTSTTGSSSVSVTLVHVAKPVTGPGIPPPLLPGELAVFISGLGNRSNGIGDLLLGNKQTTPLSSVALFVSGAGGLSSAASLPQLSPNSSIELPGLLTNVLGSSTPTGTAQFRGADAAKTVIAAIQTNTSLPVGTYTTALPVLRSDKATAARAGIVLSGVLKSDTAQTNVYVQEMTGTAGNYSIDFIDAAGRIVSSRPAEAIDAFGFVELIDSVPVNVVSARINNTSTSTAQLSGYALVTNPATSDGWLVTDPGAGPPTDSVFIVPVLSAGSGAETVLYATNRTEAAANLTIDVIGGSVAGPKGRRRAVGRNSITSPLGQQGEDTTSIPPLQTASVNLGSSAGYARVVVAPGTVSLAARSVVTNGSSAFGSGLPAVPVSAALAVGQSRRFSAVDDASATSRADAVPATYRTSLELVETNNATATVRLTLQFALSSTSLVTSSARITKDYTLTAGQFILIDELAQDIIGPSRPSIGDLRNATLDVEVVSGSGRVIPFLQSIDNGSGDMLIRIE